MSARTDATRDRIRLVRLILLAGLAAALLWVGVSGLRTGSRLRAQVDAAMRARPVNAEVDLSQAGVVVLPIDITYSGSHGAALFFFVPDRELSAANMHDMLQGFQGKMRVVDQDGRELVPPSPMAPMWIEDLPGVSLCGFSPSMQHGRHQLVLDIEAGAPGLAGLRQRLEGRYEMCGLEMMPPLVATALGAGSSLLGVLTLAGAGLWRWRTTRARRKPAAALP